MIPLGVIRAYFSSGRVVDVILLVIAMEFVVMFWRRRARAWPSVALDLVSALAPGACLLLALRAALTSASWVWVGVWLTASLPLHLLDLSRRSPR